MFVKAAAEAEKIKKAEEETEKSKEDPESVFVKAAAEAEKIKKAEEETENRSWNILESIHDGIC